MWSFKFFKKNEKMIFLFHSCFIFYDRSRRYFNVSFLAGFFIFPFDGFYGVHVFMSFSVTFDSKENSEFTSLSAIRVLHKVD